MSDQIVSISADVYLNDLAYELSRSLNKQDLKDFLLLCDAEVADMNFTVRLVEGLAEVLKDEYNVAVTIDIPGENE